MTKKLVRALSLVLLALSAGCLETPSGKQADTTGVIYRHHFVGGAEMARTTNAANLRTVLNLPASRELRDQLIQKLSKAPREFWQKEIPANALDGAEFFKPLLEDLFSAESYLEVRGPTKRPESILAVKLDGQRAQLWSTNLWKLLSAWKFGVPTNSAGAGFQGWEWKDKSGSRLVRFVRSGDWVLVGLGEESFATLPTFIDKSGKTGRPVSSLTNSFFELEADWPRLSQWFPLIAKYKLPPVQLAISPFGEYVRTEARLRFSEPFPWRHEPWKIPTNTICDPLISLTVARGIEPLLSQFPAVQKLGLKELPNQFCLWGQPSEFSVTFLTVPMPNSTNVAAQLAARLPNVIDGYLTNQPGKFIWVSNRAEFVWQGLPFIMPWLRPLKDGRTDYLFSGMFLMQRTTNSPPPELFDQFMSRPNLVYYDWEITGDRLSHAMQFNQLNDILNNRQLVGTNVPTQKWLQAARSHLGNTVTELTVTSPQELLLVRKSHAGFTGFELAGLARWIESSGFPLRYEARPPFQLRSSRASLPHTNSLSTTNSKDKVTPSPQKRR